MGKVGDASHSLLHHAQRYDPIEELQHEPDADQDEGWQRDHRDEKVDMV